MRIIGVITRGEYGVRLIDTIKTRTDFQVKTGEIPETLPDFIENPEYFVERLGINSEVFGCDILIIYAMHPDITPEITRLAGKHGVRYIIVTGGNAAANVPELEKISVRYNTDIRVHDICCCMDEDKAEEKGITGGNAFNDFVKYLGNPVFEIRVKDNVIETIKVIRGAPCGSTWYAAERLAGVDLSEAPAKAGLFIQQYPCRAQRGIKGGIHKAAHLHKAALEDAIKRGKRFIGNTGCRSYR